MTTATATEKQALTELVNLMDEAKGDHEALAAVRRQISDQIDAFIEGLRSAGVDTEALLDEVYA
jgi:type VI protein secretion system component VasF